MLVVIQNKTTFFPSDAVLCVADRWVKECILIVAGMSLCCVEKIFVVC